MCWFITTAETRKSPVMILSSESFNPPIFQSIDIRPPSRRPLPPSSSNAQRRAYVSRPPSYTALSQVDFQLWPSQPARHELSIAVCLESEPCIGDPPPSYDTLDLHICSITEAYYSGIQQRSNVSQARLSDPNLLPEQRRYHNMLSVELRQQRACPPPSYEALESESVGGQRTTSQRLRPVRMFSTPPSRRHDPLRERQQSRRQRTATIGVTRGTDSSNESWTETEIQALILTATRPRAPPRTRPGLRSGDQPGVQTGTRRSRTETTNELGIFRTETRPTIRTVTHMINQSDDELLWKRVMNVLACSCCFFFGVVPGFLAFTTLAGITFS